MIKAAFFDIDGTLLSFQTHRVSAGTVRAFELLHRHGVRTFISSGRPKVLIPPMPVTFDGYITMNGALVFVGAGEKQVIPGDILLSNPIPRSDSEAWVDYAKQHNLCTMIFTRDAMYAAQLNTAGEQIRQQLQFEMPPLVDIEQLRQYEAYQLIALMPSQLDASVAVLLPHCRLPRWHPAFTDIVATGNSKAAGMEAICRHFGIRQEDTLAFGDGANDIEMLQWAGIGVAMGNALPDVQQYADLVTTSVDDEGIEHAVNQIFS